jgi:imidazoleglycerol-phosphate dehydratase
MRTAAIQRKTGETDIKLSLNLDGSGRHAIATGVGFLDHMLTHIARHGLFDLEIEARGDLDVDAHHTVEDVGICLGKAFLEALGDMQGIRRYGQAVIPMDEALAEAAVDISGRPFLAFRGDVPRGRLGVFDTELAEEFFRAFTVNARVTAHLVVRAGSNSHHIVEALFKALARALDQATAPDPRVKGVPSTKDHLEA